MKAAVSVFAALFLTALILTLSVPPFHPIEGDALDYRLSLSQESSIWKIRKDTYNTSLPHLWDSVRAPFVKLAARNLSWGGLTRLPNILAFLFFAIWAWRVASRSSYFGGFDENWRRLLWWQWLCLPPLYFQAATNSVDMPATVALIVASFEILASERFIKRPWWAAIALQIAFGCHYWTWAVAAVLTLIGAYKLLRARDLRHVMSFLVLVAVPYPAFILLRNGLSAGNPVLPLLSSVFQSPFLSSARVTELAQTYGLSGFGRTPFDLVMVPLRLIFKGYAFDYPTGGALLFSLTAFLVPGPHRSRRLLVPAFGFFLLWWCTLQNTRFIGLALFWLTIVWVGVVRELWKTRPFRPFLATALAAYTLVWSVMAIGLQEFGARYLAKFTDRESFLRETVPTYRDAEVIRKRFEGRDGPIGLVSRTGNAFYLGRPLVYFAGHPYSNFSLTDERLCAWVAEYRLVGLYGAPEVIEFLKEKGSCFANMKSGHELRGNFAYAEF